MRDLAILTQITLFVLTGIFALLSRRNLASVVLAISALAHGTIVYLFVYVGATQLSGFASLFLVVFMVTLLKSILKEP